MSSFTFLGTGSSTGVPVLGCNCAVCHSTSSLDKRLRTAGLYTENGKTLLIDAGPDFRTQALRANLHHLDALLLTHTHFDHIAGLDDLRIFSFRSERPVPVLLLEETLDEVKKRYYYLFENASKPFVSFYPLTAARGELEFIGVKIRYFSYRQGSMPVLGFRFGNFAYVTDIKHYTEGLFGDLLGLNTLVISALRFEHSPAHFNFEEAIYFAGKVGAKNTYFTHISHDLLHEEVRTKLPPGIHLSYDGLTISCN